MTREDRLTDIPKKELGRNDVCHCGSGKKYKACHLAQDEAAAREARAKEQAKQAESEPAPAEASADRPHDHDHKPRHATTQPWKKTGQDARAVPRFNAPRRSGGS